MTNIAPKVVLVVAAAENNVIGYQGKLPWHIPADLKHFRKLTTGHPVIMGRKTWDEIYARLGKPLKDRTNIVLTRNGFDFPDGVKAAASVDDALAQADGKEIGQKVMVIGGAEIYRMFLPLAERIYLTRVFRKPQGDTYFPELSSNEWQEQECETFAEGAFITLARQSAARHS